MFEKKVNWKKVIHVICIFIISMWWLKSCRSISQTPRSVTLYYGPSDYTELDQLLDNGAYEEALNLCLEELAEVPKGSNKEMELYTLIGEIYGSYIGDRDQAVYYLNQAIEKARASQNQPRLADACYCMTKVYVNLGGDVDEGLKYAEEAEKMYRSVEGENAVETANAIYNKGKLYFENGQWYDALNSFELAAKIYELNHSITGYIYNYIGRTWVELGEDDNAMEAFIKAQKISSELNEKYNYAHSSLWLGGFYEAKEDFNIAIENYNKAIECYKTDTSYLSMESYAYSRLAYCCKQINGRWQDGIRHAVRACQAAEETGMTTEEEKEDQREYKRILKEKYYDEWKPEATDEEFEIWYQRVVLDGEDWEEE